MTKDEILTYLAKRGIIKVKNGDYTMKEKTSTVKCKNLPKKYLGISALQAMKLFFDDIGVSFTDGSLQYNLRTFNKNSLQIFLQILADDSIDFSILVDKTRAYYSATSTVKPQISKYFTEGTWDTVYTSYEGEKSELGNNKWL